MSNNKNLIEVFYSYSHKDEKMREKLETHLKSLAKQKLIADWHDRKILASNEWRNEIDKHLESAHLILLLISPDFLASDYCYHIEMKKALKRNEMKEAKVVPIILRHCNWRNTDFAELQVLPKDGLPVTMWKPRDSAYLNIVEGLEKLIHEFLKTSEEGMSKDWINSILLRKKVVRYVQEFLVKNNYLQDKVDGIPGERTKKAIRKFQTKVGLKCDGLIGPEVLNKIQELSKDV